MPQRHEVKFICRYFGNIMSIIRKKSGCIFILLLLSSWLVSIGGYLTYNFDHLYLARLSYYLAYDPIRGNTDCFCGNLIFFSLIVLIKWAIFPFLFIAFLSACYLFKVKYGVFFSAITVLCLFLFFWKF